MNFYAITALIASVFLIVITVVTLLKSRKSLPPIIFSILNFFILCWVVGCFGESTTTSPTVALFFDKVLYLGAIVSPVVYVTLIFSITKSLSKKKNFLFLGYFISFIFLVFNFSDYLRHFFILEVVRKFDFRFISIPATGWYLYIIFYFVYGSALLIELLKAFLVVGPAEKEKLKYFFISSFVITVAGSLYFALVLNILSLPIDNFFTITYSIVTAYAILKHRLMDVRIAFTRLTIFVVVYSLILGIPFWVGFKLLGGGLWLFPISLMGILSTVGPFIYLYFQKKAEDRLLVDQRRYQATLRQASTGMGRIKDLKKLLNMITYVLTRSVRIEHAVIYIKDDIKKKFIIGAVKRRSGEQSFPQEIPLFSPLELYLLSTKDPIIFEEVKQRLVDHPDPQLHSVKDLMLSLEAALVFPIFIGKDLTAIVVMGKKENGKLYTEEDLSVFTILGNQAALAIENAQFYEDMKLTQEQLFQAEKMATIGTMADGLSHQINNRFHALGFIAGDALDTINISRNENDAQKLKTIIIDLDNALRRVQENVVQGGEIVQGLLRYTRKGDAAFIAVDIDAVLKSAIEMTQFKIKTHELRIVREYDPITISKVKGNFTQLQEVFFNVIDNAYDAMMQRKTEAKEIDFKPTLVVSVDIINNKSQITFKDNGIGVKESDFQKIFTPFFTTKLSSKKGTGLGLYVIKKIIEDNHGGKVEFESAYMIGTQMKITLPVASV